MKIIGINGGPRKSWNTHTLLEKTLEGAAEIGANTELYHLYDLNFKGCSSCYACKRKGIAIKRCAMQDDLTYILDEICSCDAVVFGSPIYFACVTGEMRAFLERAWFPYLSYAGEPSSFPKKISTAFIYTMNMPRMLLRPFGYQKTFKQYRKNMNRVYGPSEMLIAPETLQFDDYDKYAMTIFSGEKRKQRHETIFPDLCVQAKEMGKRLCVSNKT